MDSDNKDKLLKIFNDDPFGLLEIKSKSKTRTEDERLIASFEEINDFYEKNGKEPENLRDIKERKLLKRLEGFKANYEKALSLKDFDRFNLLGDLKEPESEIEDEQITTIDDIFGNDSLGLLDVDDDIFTFNHTPKKIENSPDYIAKRKPCKDFSKYDNLFKQVHLELNENRRIIHPFRSEKDIEVGFYFILSGVMGYVQDMGEKYRVNKSNKNTRLRLIFENGTESDMLLRSLSAALYKDGRMITELDEKILDKLSQVTDEDNETGFIYILESLSSNQQIKSIQNLYKIGFSRISVEQRIKNASKEPTYLMAPVKIISSYQCFNMNPQKLENLLHKFFGANKLDLDIYDKEGRAHKPEEWFIAPLEIIEQAISLIITGDIIHYKYDEYQEEIVAR